MFQIEDRKIVMEEIENYTKLIQGIQGLLLVGSGATGFRDRYSDLDLVVVVEEPQNVVHVNKQIKRFLQSKFSILKEKTYHHEMDVLVSCFFFDNYLELDLGVWSFEKIKATKPNWAIIFDRDKMISKKLNDTLDKTVHSEIDDAINESLSLIWQFFRGTVVALKREHFIKALKDIDFIRNQMIELICLRNNINYDYDKSIDDIDGRYYQRLQKTYEVKMDYNSIKNVIFDVMHLYFDVININEDESVEKNKIMIHTFLKDML